MTPEEREELLAGPHVAVIGTEDDSGRPHLSPVWYEWDGNAFTLVLQSGSRKHRNLAARPRFTLCIDRRSWPYRSAVAECEVESLTPRVGYPREVASRYLDGDLLERIMERYEAIEWQLVRATVSRWYGHINRVDG
jgi:PPOX class probable F420-dependent enzyme